MEVGKSRILSRISVDGEVRSQPVQASRNPGIPAEGASAKVDKSANQRVMVDRTKDQIKNAPEFDDSMLNDAAYRDRLNSYYGEGGAGWYGGL